MLQDPIGRVGSGRKIAGCGGELDEAVGLLRIGRLRVVMQPFPHEQFRQLFFEHCGTGTPAGTHDFGDFVWTELCAQEAAADPAAEAGPQRERNVGCGLF